MASATGPGHWLIGYASTGMDTVNVAGNRSAFTAAASTYLFSSHSLITVTTSIVTSEMRENFPLVSFVFKFVADTVSSSEKSPHHRWTVVDIDTSVVYFQISVARDISHGIAFTRVPSCKLSYSHIFCSMLASQTRNRLL